MPLNFPRRRAGQGITADEWNTLTRFIDETDFKVSSNYVTIGAKGSGCDFIAKNDGGDHLLFQKAYNLARKIKKDVLIFNVVVKLDNGSIEINNSADVVCFGTGEIDVNTGHTIIVRNNSETSDLRFFKLNVNAKRQLPGADRALELYNAKKIVFDSCIFHSLNFGHFILTTGPTSQTSNIYFRKCKLFGYGYQDVVGGGQIILGALQPNNIIFDETDIIQDVTGIKYYISLKDNNIGYPLTDSEWWAETDVPKLTLFTQGETYHTGYVVGTKYQGALSIVGGDNVQIINGSRIAGSCIAGFEKAPNTNYTFEDSTIMPAVGGKIGETGIIALKGFGYDDYTNTGANFTIRNCELIDSFINCYNNTDTRIVNIKIYDNKIKSNVKYSSQVDNNFPGGIFVEGVNILDIRGNTVEGSTQNKLEVGLSLRKCNHIEYGNNTFRNAKTGVNKFDLGNDVKITIPNIFENVDVNEVLQV